MPLAQQPKYPLLEEVLALRQMTLQPMYTTREIAKLFGVSVRSIQSWSPPAGWLRAICRAGRNSCRSTWRSFFTKASAEVPNELPHISHFFLMSHVSARYRQIGVLLRVCS